jgi:low temperature requirement protein LtrA
MGEASNANGHDIDHDKPDPVTKQALILHRRQEENLPWFGDLVEHADDKELRYHEHEDARNIELFFDLFFVAIFSTFTKNHEINSSEALSSYAVYFGVIWASWLQISLYDVRFGFDSLFERFTKATHFVAFIGFASATGCLEMDPPAEKKSADLSGFESLNVLMIVTRVVFAIQYGVAAFLVGRKHKPALVPLALTSLMYGFASFVYGMLLKFFLLDHGETQSFYGYYAVIALELVALSWINSKYTSISFTDTHLHKRTMVLTMMILGEGIIVCAFTFAKISSKTGWTANTFGQALCVILSIVSVLQPRRHHPSTQ